MKCDFCENKAAIIGGYAICWDCYENPPHRLDFSHIFPMEMVDRRASESKGSAWNSGGARQRDLIDLTKIDYRRLTPWKWPMGLRNWKE